MSDWKRAFSSGFTGTEQKQKTKKKGFQERHRERMAKMSASDKASRARKIAAEKAKNKNGGR